MADLPVPRKLTRYQQIMERIFFWHYQDGTREIVFERTDMERAAQELGINLPKNLGDIPYTFRYRGMLPDSILLIVPSLLSNCCMHILLLKRSLIGFSKKLVS